MRLQILWLLSCSGCIFISDEHAADRLDVDEDGVVHTLDCDDNDASVGEPYHWYADLDGDTFGDPENSTQSCDPPSGYVDDASDCDDTDASAHPGAIWYIDADGDGYGEEPSIERCERVEGFTTVSGDCDDGDAEVHPDAEERCNESDDNCDGDVDEGVTPPTWYADADGDGYGLDAESVEACDQPDGHAAESGDCDEEDVAINPGADEVCDEIDNDCDALIDDEDESLVGAPTWYTDADEDGYGDPDSEVSACLWPEGLIEDSSDCDDSDPDISPDAAEICDDDDVDEDCDGLADNEDSEASGESTWYSDGDGDGYGDVESTTQACDPPSGYTEDATDCDDDSASVSPAESEICGDGLDNDCDQLAVDCGFYGDMELSETAMLEGVQQADGAGSAVSAAGDVDGDGLADLWIGAKGMSGAYLVLGPFSGSVSLTTVHATLIGSGHAGTSVAGGFDANSDGQFDVIVGDSYNNEAFLFFGPMSGVLQDTSADSWLDGEIVATAGDINGDGAGDILIGIPDDDSGGTDAGIVYAYYGSATGDIGSSGPDGVFTGAAGHQAGASLGGAGDVNADGLDDIIVGAPYEDTAGSSGGAAYILNGPASGAHDLSDADAIRVSENSEDWAGSSVAGAGDVNDDGYDDVIVGCPYMGMGTATTEGAYLILGPLSGTADFSTASARLEGDGSGKAGESVSSAGDVNADGFDDLLVGDTDINDEAGVTYLLYGPVTGTLSLVEDSTARLLGESQTDYSGGAITTIGDSDGDGYDDLAVGAHGREVRGWGSTGTVYVIAGGPGL